MSDLSVKLKTILDIGAPDAQMMRLQDKIKKTADKLDDVKKKMEEVGNSKVPTDQYKVLADELKKAESEIDKFTIKANQMKELGTANGKAWSRLQYELNISKEAAEQLRGEMAQMRDDGEAFKSGTDTQKFAELTAQKAQLERDLEIAGQTGGEKMKKAFDKKMAGIKKSFAKLGGVAKKALGALGGKALGGFKGLLSAKQHVDGLNKRIMGLAKRVFIFSMITKALRAMRQAISEGVKDYAKYSGSFNSTMSEFASATATAKNAIAGFAAPIIQAIVPALTTLVNWLTSAIGALSNFMAVVSGRGTWSMATKQQKDYAQSLSGTAGAAKKAEQALAGFDDLNVLNTGNDSGGGGAGGAVDPSSMWTEQEAVKPEWFNPDDWTSLGVKVAEGIRDALDAIPWDTIKEKAATIGTRLAEFVNGVIAVPSMWTSVGTTIAEGLNTGLTFAHAFLGNVNWTGLGTDIGLMLNQAVADFDWSLLGLTIADSLNMVFQTLAGFATTFDFSSFGTGIGTSINTVLMNTDWNAAFTGISNMTSGIFTSIAKAIQSVDWFGFGRKFTEGFGKIDWGAITKSIFSLLASALFGLIGLLGGVIAEVCSGIGDYFSEKIEEAGGNVVLGLLKGIWDAFVGIGIWIYENIVKPFVDAFKEMFGIHSPSKVMDEIGGFLIDGLFGGIKRVWEVLMSWLGPALEGIKTAFSVAWEVIKTVAGVAWGLIKTVIINPITTVWEKISSILDKIKRKWEDIWTGIKDFVKKPINGIIGAINGMIDGVVGGINAVIRALNNLSFDIPDWVPFAGGKHFGFAIAEMSAKHIPTLANGGITTGATLAQIGEAGKEAVLPLENNTGWMEDLADAIKSQGANSRPINLQIDGRTFAKLVMPYLSDEDNRIGTRLVTT